VRIAEETSLGKLIGSVLMEAFSSAAARVRCVALRLYTADVAWRQMVSSRLSIQWRCWHHRTSLYHCKT
jgi:hypothetical protein